MNEKNSKSVQHSRDDFEKWITSPPFERSVERNSNDETKTAWPGAYRVYEVELAWEAWKAGVASGLDDNVCDSNRISELENAIRNFKKAKGRYNTQIACERLLKLLPETDREYDTKD